MRIACLLFPPGASAAAVRAVAEACYRFTPQIAVREGEAVFLEIGRSLGLFTERSFFLRAGALSRRFGLSPRVAAGASASEALALARFGGAAGSPPPALPLESLRDFCSPFAPDEARSKKADATIRALRELGLSSVAEFARLPAEALPARFGGAGLELQRVVRGEHQLPWPAFRVPERILEQTDLDGALDLESLVFVLKTLVDRAAARLRGRCLRAACVRLSIRIEGSSLLTERDRVRRWDIGLALPQGSASELLKIIQERLALELGRRPLAAPAIRVRVEVTETAPGRGSQKDFFSRKEEEREAWNALVARLSTRLGSRKAFLASPVDRHLPEGAWRRTLREPEEKPAGERPPPARGDRPSRVLAEPRALLRQGDALVDPRSRRFWRIREWLGPERLQGEWWLDPRGRGFDRDYYRVGTETGEDLWLFQESAGPLYLHGFFD